MNRERVEQTQRLEELIRRRQELKRQQQQNQQQGRPMRRTRKKPERFSEMNFIKGSGAAKRFGYDETDMEF